MARTLDDLVMEMSTELLGVDAENLAGSLQRWLEQLGLAVDADRAYVLKTSVEGRSLGEAFEEWWAPGVEQRNTPIPELPRSAQRFWFQSLRTGEVVHAEDVEELEAQAPEAVEALRRDGVRSILFVPLLAKEQTVGFIGFEGRVRSRGWNEVTISRVRTVGELLMTTVERCHADIERAAAARALTERNAELERSNRELQQFASVVSHDLNQPLLVVSGFVELLQAVALDHPTRAEEARTYGETALRATKRMSALIDDVLTVAQAGAPLGHPVPVDLASVAAEVLVDLDSLVTEAGATVTVGSLPEVEGNPTQLRQLLQNLVANALKFRHPDRPAIVRVEGSETDGRCVITVTDNGVGIDPGDRASVFEMFTRKAGQGTPGLGIGLAVCARVADNHHGRIRIEQSPEGGCTFVVVLPRRQPSPTA